MSCIDLEKNRIIFSEIMINSQKNITSKLIGNIDDEIDNNNHIFQSMSQEEQDVFLDDFLEHEEYMIGLGFVVLQQYIKVVYGNLRIEKKVAFKKGPRHKSEKTFVKIVDFSANYWKHHNEWNLQENSDKRKRSNDFFKIVLYSHDKNYIDWILNYRLKYTLEELSIDGKLASVLCKIDEWKTCLS